MQYGQIKKLPNAQINDIYMGNGVSELISMAMQGFLNDGDEILIPSPDYPLWTAAANLAGGKPVHYICDESANWYPDLADMEKKVTSRTKGIVIINPNNPTGALYPKELLEQIAEFARRHDLVIFSDEIYDRLLYDGQKHISIASLCPDLLCVTFNGLSKSHRMPGLDVYKRQTKDNAITRSAKAVLKTRSDRQIIQKVKDLAETYRREYALTDPQMEITAEAFMEEAEAMDRESQKKVLFALLEAPYGVQAMSNDVEGLVESSLNLGIMNTAENSWHISYSIRSSVESRKEWLKQKLTHLADFLGASHSETGDYPGWEFVRESGLRNLMCQVFEEMYGKKPQVEAIHAGLELSLIHI